MDLSSEHKMKKKCKGEKVDRISSLPDKTIGHILSFLPTKHAVTTSVLSRRWQYLFTLVSNFDFDDSFTSHPRWNDYELADLQQQVSLRLCGDLMKLPASFQLPCLKVLHLFSVKFANEGCFSKLISGCPLLEDLALSFVWENVKVINISSTNLRRLTLNCSEGFSFKPSCRANIILDLPSLLYLEYEGYLASHFVMKNLKSIEEARIHIMSERDCSEFVSLSSFLELISGLCTANSIHLAGDSLEAVSCLPNFSNLTHLELDWYKWLNWRQVLPEILHSAPMLETLVFPWGLMKSESEDEYDSEQDFWSKPSNIPSCLSSSLKTVDIKFFNGFDEELRIVTYFLSHGKVLENLILHWRKISKQERRELNKLSKMRASKACLITVDEDRELYKGLQIDLSKFPNLKRTADS